MDSLNSDQTIDTGDRLRVADLNLDSLKYVSQIRESLVRMGYPEPGGESVDEIRAYLLEKRSYLANKLSGGNHLG